MRAQVAILTQVRLHHAQQVQTRIERREAGLGQDLERILERTLALVGPGASRAPPPLLPTSEAPVRVDRPGGDRPSSDPAPPSTPRSGQVDPLAPACTQPIQTSAPTDTATSLRSHALVALIERIDRFVRDGRPALSLSLGRVGWTVQLERTGAGEVSLTVSGAGARDFPTRQVLGEALGERGLTLGALQRLPEEVRRRA